MHDEPSYHTGEVLMQDAHSYHSEEVLMHDAPNFHSGDVLVCDALAFHSGKALMHDVLSSNHSEEVLRRGAQKRCSCTVHFLIIYFFSVRKVLIHEDISFHSGVMHFHDALS